MFFRFSHSSVHIAYLHNKSQSVQINGHSLSPIVIVTALVDRIEINSGIKMEMDKNIKLSGFTSWVGKSSSEVTMKLEQELSPSNWIEMLQAKFLVCARDTNNKGSAIMNPMELITSEEKAIFELGESKQN
jgi:acyl-coenzyme A thioesterase 9